MEVITISQDIIDEVNKKMIEKRKEAKKQGNKLTKQEMTLLYNILKFGEKITTIPTIGFNCEMIDMGEKNLTIFVQKESCEGDYI